MKLTSKFNVSVLPLLACLVVSCAAMAAENGPQSVLPQGTGAGVPQQMEGFNLQGYSDTGEKAWDIKGDKADINGDQVDVTNVNANNYGEDKDTNLKARKGTIDKTTGDIHLQEDVVITTDDGAKIKTDTLDWKRKDNVVKTQDVVTLEDETMKIKGKGMEAHPELKTAKLEADVTADIKSEAKDKRLENRIQITSDGPMEVDQIKQMAVFKDNVMAIESSTDRTLKADRMEVYFDAKTRKLKQIVCTGHVEIQQGENITYSESMIYRTDEQRMILTGKPKLILDTGDQTVGDVFAQ